jgi:hypothetical protein
MRMRLTALAISAHFVVLLASAAPLDAAGTQPRQDAKAEAAVKDFNKAIADYMALRRRLRSEVSGPVKNSSSSQVTNASDALAAAIERARPDAKVGSIFTPAIAAVIKKQITDAIRDDDLEDVLSDIDDEQVTALKPAVHLRLPVSAQMATMPPSLLKVLPPLPKELEYRILGRYLVIRDVDASLILDYIPAAVPR